MCPYCGRCPGCGHIARPYAYPWGHWEIYPYRPRPYLQEPLICKKSNIGDALRLARQAVS